MSDALDQYTNKEDEERNESHADAGDGNTAGKAQNNSAYSPFGHNDGSQGRAQGTIESVPRRQITQTDSTMQYLEGLDTKKLYCTEFDSHMNTLCAGSAYRKMSGTGVVCEVKGFALGLRSLNVVDIETA